MSDPLIPRRLVVAEATASLAAAGVPSPEFDARALLAQVVGCGVAELALRSEVTLGEQQRFWELVARRAGREPLQHLLGRAPFRRLELAVGPGVFVPRPETELLAGWAIEQAQAVATMQRRPVVVDLGTGSGAIAGSICDEVPTAVVYAVELDERAHEWATRNLADTAVELRRGDLAEAFPELDGQVDVVVSNPPYIPWEAWESVAVEARDHDPHLALFSGDDGLDAIRAVERRAARLLRPGGVVGVEHADVQGESAPEVFATAMRWQQVRDHRDLAGRPRFVTARLAP